VSRFRPGDAAGRSSFGRCRRLLRDDGVYLATAPSAGLLLWVPWTRLARRRRAAIAFTGLRRDEAKRADLLLAGRLVADGALRPVVGARYPLARIADAHAHLARGKRGAVVVTTAGTAPATAAPAA
ncbi:MAG TPA: zinc-binding dehydrogenase, partial [Pseudonocardiaceae bacterium]